MVVLLRLLRQVSDALLRVAFVALLPHVAHAVVGERRAQAERRKGTLDRHSKETTEMMTRLEQAKRAR